VEDVIDLFEPQPLAEGQHGGVTFSLRS